MAVRRLLDPFLVDTSGGDEPAGRRIDVIEWDLGTGEIAVPRAAVPPEGEALDARGMIAVPGLVCAHAEPALALMPGMPILAEDDAARRKRYLAVLDRDAFAAAARLCAAEAALAGVTLVYALHRGPMFEGVLDVIAAAFREVGVRVCAAAAIDERGTGVEGARAALAENLRFAEACAARDDGMAAAMAGIGDPEALPSLLAEVVGVVRRAEIPFHLILSGSPAARHRLAEKGALRPGSVAVIAAALDEEERALLRDLQVFAAVTPRADAAARALPPLRGFARTGVFGGFGADCDVLAEGAALACSRAGEAPEQRVAAWRLLSNGWDLAAETFERTFGRWNPGSPADIAVLDEPIPGSPSPVSIRVHLQHASARHVRHVLVGGRVVVRDRMLATADERAIRGAARDAANATWARAAREG